MVVKIMICVCIFPETKYDEKTFTSKGCAFVPSNNGQGLLTQKFLKKNQIAYLLL